jgi:hypothetical protein
MMFVSSMERVITMFSCAGTSPGHPVGPANSNIRVFTEPNSGIAQRSTPTFPLRFQCTNLNCRRPLCNGREEARHFFPQVRDRLAIAREMPQQASLEESIKQRIEGGPGDSGLSAAK